MRGIVEAISTLLITGILIGVVGTVYFWGLPLIQKNKDISVLESTEDFMKELNERVKLVASAGGRETIQFNQPGIIKFEGTSINVILDTEGTIYAAESPVPLSRNGVSVESGVWGIDQPERISVVANNLGDKRYRDTFDLRYIPLSVSSFSPKKEYFIQLDGTNSIGGQGSDVIITSEGTTEEPTQGGTRVSALVKIVID